MRHFTIARVLVSGRQELRTSHRVPFTVIGAVLVCLVECSLPPDDAVPPCSFRASSGEHPMTLLN